MGTIYTTCFNKQQLCIFHTECIMEMLRYFTPLKEHHTYPLKIKTDEWLTNRLKPIKWNYLSQGLNVHHFLRIYFECTYSWVQLFKRCFINIDRYYVIKNLNTIISQLLVSTILNIVQRSCETKRVNILWDSIATHITYLYVDRKTLTKEQILVKSQRVVHYVTACLW